jgi:hypothetical protein
MEKECGIFEYTSGIFCYEHPVEFETTQNLTYIWALPEMDLPPLRG